MEKYQITGTTVSFRINEEEKEMLNALATRLQTENEEIYNNSKQLVFATCRGQ